MKQLLTTDRLDAYVVSRSLVGPYLSYEKRNREAFRPYSVAQRESYYTLGSFRDVCDRQYALYEERRMVPLLFFAKGTHQHVIALVSLNQLVWGSFRSAKISYSVDRDRFRQGYGAEAVTAVLAYAFHQLGLHRIEAHIQSTNAASLALARHLGFQEEGVAKGYLHREGQWIDHLRFALLNLELDMTSFS
ncbi:MAG: GNAT family N-acetyltransferase [Sphaerochaetaceae bacterium]